MFLDVSDKMNSLAAFGTYLAYVFGGLQAVLCIWLNGIIYAVMHCNYGPVCLLLM